jgi:hypothetical protein
MLLLQQEQEIMIGHKLAAFEKVWMVGLSSWLRHLINKEQSKWLQHH